MESETPIPDGVTDQSTMIESMAPGVELLGQALQAADLGLVTWAALRIAEHAQYWASHALNVDPARFLSLEGMLCDQAGKIVKLDADLPLLHEAFAAAAEDTADGS